MVVAKSKKQTKYTYAERVLSALSCAQKEHRRNAIHQSTLRAQVRKAATARKDKLGPQWSKWISKAVHKLEEEGVLESTHPTGSVAFTPNGKKLIAAARRNLSLPLRATPTTAQEDSVWKYVTQQSGQGLKRKQPIRFDEELDGEETASVSRTPRSKRVRVSSVAVNTPVSKMNKAELMKQLLSLQNTRASSRFSQETDETSRLRAELKERQEELNCVRSELAQVRNAGPTDDIDTPYDPFIPEPTSPLTPSPEEYTSASGQARLGLPQGVTRTLSGSLISDLSKQATPAPSSPMGPDDDIPFEDNDVFGPLGVPTPGLADPKTISYPLPTPLCSPSRHNSEENVNSARDTQAYKALIQNMKEIFEEKEKDLHDKHASLETSLRTETTELQALQSEHARTLSSHETSLSEKEACIGDLQRLIFEKKMELSSRDVVISEHSSVIVELKASLTVAEARLKELETALLERDSSVVGMKDEIERRVSEQRRELEAVKILQVATAEELAATKIQNASLTQQLQTALDRDTEGRAALAEANNSVQRLAAQAASYDQQISESQARTEELTTLLSQSRDETESEVKILQATIDSLRISLQSSELDVKKLQEQVATVEEHKLQLSTELASKTQTIDTLKRQAELDTTALSAEVADARAKLDTNVAQLTASQDNTIRLRRGQVEMKTQLDALQEISAAQLSQKDTEIVELHSQVELGHQTTQGIQTTLDLLVSQKSAEALEYEEKISSLNSSLQTAEDKAYALRNELDVSTAAHRDVDIQLEQRRIELVEMQQALDKEQSRVGELANDLERMTFRAREAENEVEELKISKQVDEKTICELKDGYTKLKKVQLDSLAELEQKVTSAQSSPMPKRRITLSR